jgi:hypothetical protein
VYEPILFGRVLIHECIYDRRPWPGQPGVMGGFAMVYSVERVVSKRDGDQHWTMLDGRIASVKLFARGAR